MTVPISSLHVKAMSARFNAEQVSEEEDVEEYKPERDASPSDEETPQAE